MSKLGLIEVPKMGTNFNGEESTVKINVDAFALQALSGKNLYRNLIRAIIRELSCNALDSHVMANKAEVPFSVHLPTKIEPYFSVRDYGIGLDDQGVRDVYLTYFGSTKRNCEKTIGAWGLGSKSPLGYTDNFTINAIKDGVKRMYVVYKNSEGMPAVKLMAQDITSECNGLEIVMPVIDEYDMEKFTSEAKHVYKWFNVKPTFNYNFEPNEDEWVNRNATRRVGIKTKGSSVIVHGNIEYPIDRSQLNRIEGLDVSDVLYYCSLVLFADLNTVDYAMSREELSYNEKTLNTINGIMIELRDALPSLIVDMMVGLTDVESYIMAENLKRNQLFRNKRQEIEALSPLHVKLKEDPNYFDFKCDNTKYYKTHRSTYFRPSARHMVTIVPGESVTLWINDTGKKNGLKALVNYNAINCNFDRDGIYVFDDDSILKMVEEKYSWKPSVRYLSELNVPPKEERKKYDTNKCIVRLYDQSDAKFSFNNYFNEVINSEDSKYYIKISGYKTGFASYKIKKMMEYVGCTRLYGANANAIEALEETDHIDLVEAVKEKVQSEIDNFNVLDYYYQVDGNTVKMLSAFEKYEDVSAIKSVIDHGNKDLSMFNEVATIFNLDVSKLITQYQDMVKTVIDMDNMLRNKYPLVYAIHSYNIDKTTQTELEYYISSKASIGA